MSDEILESDEELRKKKERRELRARRFGQVITPLYAAGYSLVITVFFSYLAIFAGMATGGIGVILALVFATEFSIHMYLYKNSVPDTFVMIFAGKLFEGLSAKQRKLLWVGIFVAIGGGFTLAALTFTKGMVAMTAVLALFSASCPPVGMLFAGILAFATICAFSGLIIKWIRDSIKNDLIGQVGQFFKDLFDTKGKSYTQHGLEVFFKLLFTATIVVFAIIGMIATVGAVKEGCVALFKMIPAANLFAAEIAASILAFGIMGITRIPWAVDSCAQTFSRVGTLVGRKIYNFFNSTTQVEPANKPVDPNELHISPERILLSLAVSGAHAYFYGAMTEHGSGVLEDMTQNNLSAAEAGEAGMTTGAVMAGGLGFFALAHQPAMKAKMEAAAKTYVEPTKPIVGADTTEVSVTTTTSQASSPTDDARTLPGAVGPDLLSPSIGNPNSPSVDGAQPPTPLSAGLPYSPAKSMA